MTGNLFTANEQNWPDLTLTDLNKSTQLHDVFIGHAHQRHDYLLIDCSETRTVSARLVLNACIPMLLFTMEFSAVQFSLCAVNNPLRPTFLTVSSLNAINFYRATHMQQISLVRNIWPIVCPSQAITVSKRMNESSWFSAMPSVTCPIPYFRRIWYFFVSLFT